MEAKNFRIGNIIRPFTQDGYELEIRPLKASEFFMVDNHPESTKPVELTKDWLIKFGFTEGNKCYKNAYSLEVLKTDFYLRPSYQDGFYWGFNISDEKLDCELNDVKPLKYVHELQNLFFAITGTELELKHECSTCG